MPGRAPRRYKMDENGTVRSAFHGKLPEEFTERDMLAFAADTDLLLLQKVSEETFAAIHAAGYDYQGGTVIPRPGKEETDMAEQETKIPAQERPSIRSQLEAGAKEALMAYVPVPNHNISRLWPARWGECFYTGDHCLHFFVFRFLFLRFLYGRIRRSRFFRLFLYFLRLSRCQ